MIKSFHEIKVGDRLLYKGTNDWMDFTCEVIKVHVDRGRNRISHEPDVFIEVVDEESGNNWVLPEGSLDKLTKLNLVTKRKDFL